VPELLAFNKADIAPEAKRLVDRHPGSVMLSASTGEGVDGLLRTIGDRLRALAPVIELRVPYDRGDVLAALHREGEVLSEAHEPEATVLRARFRTGGAGRFEEFVISP
jgi:GTP-binding protein HflX